MNVIKVIHNALIEDGLCPPAQGCGNCGKRYKAIEALGYAAKIIAAVRALKIGAGSPTYVLEALEQLNNWEL